MRTNVKQWVRAAVETLALEGPVYEFGSYQVADQLGLADLRPLFPGRTFIGCDMRDGPGVDRIEDLSRLTLEDDVARTVVCVETLEHVFDVRRAVDEMLRVLAPGGVIVITSPFAFRIHDYPSDYWRLTPSCLARLLAPLSATLIGWQGFENDPHTVFAVGCKGPVSPARRQGLNRLMNVFDQWLAGEEARRPWQERLKYGMFGWLRSRGERYRWRDQYRAGYAMFLPVDQNWRQDLIVATQTA